MINSGSNAGHQTGGWTNFTQDPCQTTSVPTVRPLVCRDGNPYQIKLGDPMGTTGGELETVFDQLRRCWTNYPGLDTNGDGIPDQPWEMRLPVIDCPGNNVGPCSTPVGAVSVQVVWITRTDKNQMNEVPRRMADWSCPAQYTGQQCWYGIPDVFEGFAKHFKLQDILNNSDAFYEDKTIYFLPSCDANIPTGHTGGENYGILAKYPVLVE